MTSVWLIERGYYEDRVVEAVCADRVAADRKAQELHPSEDHFFGSGPTCYQWQPDEKPEGFLACKGCTMAAAEWEVCS